MGLLNRTAPVAFPAIVAKTRTMPNDIMQEIAPLESLESLESNVSNTGGELVVYCQYFPSPKSQSNCWDQQLGSN